MNVLVSIENMSKYFGSEKVLENINLKVYENEILVIMGSSGIGKSTLLNLIGNLLEPDEGTVIYNSAAFTGSKVPFPMIFQEFDSLLNWKTVDENIRFVNKTIKEKKLSQLLKTVDLIEHRHKKPGALSGGMKQRLAIARALACESKLLLMDEPFGSLDRELRLKMQEFILSLQREMGIGIVMVTHDEEEAHRLADRMVRL